MQNVEVSVVYNGQKVLSTKQITVLFKCSRQVIGSAFNYKPERFIAGVDYFHLEGEELRNFKNKYAGNNSCLVAGKICCSPCSPLASTLYLWTQSGVEKLAKIIGTDEAKLIYISLKFGYFQAGNNPLPPAGNNSLSQLSPLERYNELKFLIANCKDEKLRDDLIKAAFELINTTPVKDSL